MSRPQRLTYDPGIVDGEPWAVEPLAAASGILRGIALAGLLWLAILAIALWWTQR